MIDLVILGVGFPDIIQTIYDINSHKKKINVLGFLDDNPNLLHSEISGFPVLGGLSWLKFNRNICVVNTIAKNARVRKSVHDKIVDLGSKFANIIHPSVGVKFSNIGSGVIISKGVYLENRSKIGDFTIILPNSTIGHDCELGSNNFIASGVHIGGYVKTGNFCWIGAGTTINPRSILKDNCVTGSNANIIVKSQPCDFFFTKPTKPSKYNQTYG